MGIVERLRGWQAAEAPPQGRTAPDAVSDMHEAADLIERLRGWLQHRGGPLCMARYYGDAKCDCGLSALIKEIEGD